MRTKSVDWLASETNSALSRYIAVHDDVFRRSWRRVFQKVGYQNHLASIVDQEAALRKLQTTAYNLYQETTDTNKEFVHFLYQYVCSLHKAVEVFVPLLLGLTEKSQGKRYSAGAYRADLKRYESAQSDYRAVGEALQERWEIYRLL